MNFSNESMMEDDIYLREQDFHNAVREYIVSRPISGAPSLTKRYFSNAKSS